MWSSIDEFMKEFAGKRLSIACDNAENRAYVVRYLMENYGFFVNKDEMDSIYGRVATGVIDSRDNENFYVRQYQKREFDFHNEKEARKIIAFDDFLLLIGECAAYEADNWKEKPLDSLYREAVSR